MNLPKAVAVIGAGTMGNGIAQVFAQSGVDTHLIDVDPAGLERGVANIHKSLGKFVEKGKLSAEDAAATKSRLHASTEMDPLAGVDLCVEAITENLEELFCLLFLVSPVGFYICGLIKKTLSSPICTKCLLFMTMNNKIVDMTIQIVDTIVAVTMVFFIAMKNNGQHQNLQNLVLAIWDGSMKNKNLCRT